MIDHERLFRLVFDERWSEAASLLYQHHDELTSDPLLRQTAERFVEGISAALASNDSRQPVTLLETLFLFHLGGYLRLPQKLFERVVEQLVQQHRERPEVALAYARYCPSVPSCASTLREYGNPIRTRAEYRDRQIDVVTSRTEADSATRPLLRSGQEAQFYLALKDEFPDFVVYPNVALSAFVDFERVKNRLGRPERHYFYRALVDFVVFDSGLRPRHFFELDSPLHDDAARSHKDEMKDRILAAAGQMLLRVRCRGSRSDRRAFRQLIQDLMLGGRTGERVQPKPTTSLEAPAEPFHLPT